MEASRTALDTISLEEARPGSEGFAATILQVWKVGNFVQKKSHQKSG